MEIQVVNNHYISKGEVMAFRDKAVEMVLDGEVAIPTAMAAAKDFQLLGKEIEDAIRPIMNDKVEQMEKRFQANGYVFERTEAGITYDYKNCGDPEYNALKSQMEALTNKIKEREVFLRSIPEGSCVNVVDTATGEEVSVFPPLKRSTTTMKMTKVKE